MKIKRHNIPALPVTNMDITDLDKLKTPLSVKVCNRFGLMCQLCRQLTPHPSPKESDRTDDNWTGKQTKTQKPAGDRSLMSHWDLPSPQYNPNSKQEELDKINIDKLSLDPDYPQQEPLQVTDSLITPPTTEYMEKTATQEKTYVWTGNNQQKEEEYKE